MLHPSAYHRGHLTVRDARGHTEIDDFKVDGVGALEVPRILFRIGDDVLSVGSQESSGGFIEDFEYENLRLHARFGRPVRLGALRNPRDGRRSAAVPSTERRTAGFDLGMRIDRLPGYGHTSAMPRAKVKATYSLDVETVRALERTARLWNVSKSAALRRAIQAAAAEGRGHAGTAALDALGALQRALSLTRGGAKAWADRARRERRAASARK